MKGFESTVLGLFVNGLFVNFFSLKVIQQPKGYYCYIIVYSDASAPTVSNKKGKASKPKHGKKKGK